MLKTIEVVYDGANLHLADETQSQITLDSGADRVQWLVRGCPNDCIPRIEFLVDDEQPWAFGPFTTLRETPSYVLSAGARAEAGTFPYQLTLPRSPSSTTENEGLVAPPLTGLTLLKAATSATTGVRAYVYPDGEDSLIVEPDIVSLRTGDTVEWIFEGIAETPSWIPRVAFYSSPEGSYQVTSHFGPFSSLTVEETRVVGAGSNGVVGQFGYLVQAIDATTGEPMRSKIKDPGMANDGDPPGGLGG